MDKYICFYEGTNYTGQFLYCTDLTDKDKLTDGAIDICKEKDVNFIKLIQVLYNPKTGLYESLNKEYIYGS